VSIHTLLVCSLAAPGRSEDFPAFTVVYIGFTARSLNLTLGATVEGLHSVQA
jgi:hypothetical protein